MLSSQFTVSLKHAPGQHIFLIHFINKTASSLAIDAMAFGIAIRRRRITSVSDASLEVSLIHKISYKIHHCKFVSQGACIFLKKQKNSKRHVLLKLEQKTDEEKIYRRTEFFTSWTITSEKCTRAHVQESKSIYLSIDLSI